MPPPPDARHLTTVPSLTWDDCRLLVESVVDYAIYMLDVQGNVVTWGAGARRLKGYANDEIIGRHVSVFYTPEEREAGRPATVLETAEREGRYEDEGFRVRKDGTRFWANVVVTALRDDRGRLLGFAKVTRDLTDRRNAEQELRRSEERFRLLVENVVDYAIYMLDAGGRVATWNLGAERMKGFAPSEIVGRDFAVFFPPEDVTAGKPARELEEARKHGRFEDEGFRVRKDGSRFWANATLTALRDEAGQLVGFAKITRDLTARRHAEEIERKLLREQVARATAEAAEQQLRESEERYRSLSERLEIVLEGVADGITVQDRTGRIVFANTAAARICGFSSGAELIQAPPGEIARRFETLGVDGRPMPVDELPSRRVLAGERSASAVFHLRERARERDWWISLRSSAVLGPDGATELAVNIWHDVSAQRREEAQARYVADVTAALNSSLLHDEMLSALARSLVPDLADWCSVFLLDGDTLRRVATTDEVTEKQARLGVYVERLPLDPAHAGAVWSVVRSGTALVLNELDDAALSRSTQNREALAMLRELGLRSALVVPIKVRARVLGAIALVHTDSERRFDTNDVTVAEELGRRAGVAVENAQLYAAAQDAAKTAEEASRAKDEFLATVSHELRTPLNAIVGWSALLKDRAHDPSIAKPLEVIHRNAQAQVRIIDDILDVSRVITGKLRLDAKPADLVSVTQDTIEVVRPSAEAKRIDVTFAPPGEPCLVVVDPERIQQVVWNLLSNAVKFTPAGGKIFVSVERDGTEIRIQVRDTGSGIDPGFLPHVFERFKQADSTITRRVGGLGLGLALVKHIVELHGGRASATSPGPGQGSTFTISLPIRAVIPDPVPARVRSESSSTDVEAVSLAGVRVLVVDDEPDARDLVSAVLVGAGAEVETARSAAEGFAAFRRMRPDVLVSDIGMPDEDGFSLMRRVRALPAAEGGRTPSLALTAFVREEDRARTVTAGFTTHVGKPVDPDALASAVANLAQVGARV